MLRLVACLCFGFITATLIGQQVAFTAFSGAKQVVQGSTFEVTFTLENAKGSNFQPPNFSPFKRISGPSQAYQSSFVNGKSTTSSSYSYTLQALKPGNYKLPGAKIQVNGKTLSSNGLSVEVVKGRSDLAVQDEARIFILAEIDTTALFVGQQAILRYKIYTQVNIENYNIIAESSYDGCFTQVLDTYKERVVKEVREGVEYTTKVLRKVALFPQQNGKIKIDPLVVRVGIPDRKSKRRSFFSSFNLKTKNLTSNAIELQVKSPHYGAPSLFSGAVGNYRADFSIRPLEATTDDAISVRLRLIGNGDIKMIRPPDLNLPSVFEIYEPKVVDEKMINATDSVRGEKIIDYLILTRSPGKYVVKPEFTFFNPENQQFNTIRDSFVLQISQGRNFAQADNRLQENQTDEDAAPIFSTDLRSMRQPFISTAWYWSALGVPLFAFLLLVWRDTRKLGSAEEIDHTALAHQRLASAQTHLDSGDAAAFYEDLAHCLKKYVSHKTQIPAADLSKDRLRQQLASLKIPSASIETLMQLLDECDYALYAGLHNDHQMHASYRQAVEVIKKLE